MENKRTMKIETEKSVYPSEYFLPKFPVIKRRSSIRDRGDKENRFSEANKSPNLSKSRISAISERNKKKNFLEENKNNVDCILKKRFSLDNKVHELPFIFKNEKSKPSNDKIFIHQVRRKVPNAPLAKILKGIQNFEEKNNEIFKKRRLLKGNDIFSTLEVENSSIEELSKVEKIYNFRIQKKTMQSKSPKGNLR